jgi:hypothetical protein
MIANRFILPLLWTASLPVAALLSGEGNFIGYFPKMILHELGHALFSLCAAVPAIAFFFVTFSLSDAPVPMYALILGVAELVGIWYALRRGWILVPLLLTAALASHLFFIFNAARAEPFFVWGGIGGEFLWSLLLLALMIEIPRLQSVRWRVIFAIVSMVYWRSTIAWGSAWYGLRGIPYPRDNNGGRGLFVNPFDVVKGKAIGDIERLTRDYGWSEQSIIQSYVIFSVVCLVLYCALWWYHFKSSARAVSREELP